MIALFVLLSSINSPLSMPDFGYGLVQENIRLIAHSLSLTPSPAKLTATKSKHTNSVVMVGDVMLARNVEYLSLVKDFTYPYQGLDLKTFANNSYVVANFESSIPETHIPTAALNMTFSVSPVLLENFVQAGFSHVSLANNHSYDYGQEGYNNTVTQLAQASITPFGHPNQISKDTITYLKLEDKTIALIGLHTLSFTPSNQALQSLFTEAEKNSDFQIVYIHWGEEYQTQNSALQKKLATSLVMHGADLIIGHHPHVVQNIDFIDGVPVFYSLGNYIFDQYFSNEVQTGLVVQLDFSSEATINIIPVNSIGTLSQPHFMTPKDHLHFLSNLAKISAPELRKQITSGTIKLDSRVATSAKIAMID